ncbi:MAG: hypothetical protein H6807_00995 [Planctomycetes bacterium]|nr:hypothetical protein [Planctomycetota bacterium]
MRLLLVEVWQLSLDLRDKESGLSLPRILQAEIRFDSPSFHHTFDWINPAGIGIRSKEDAELRRLLLSEYRYHFGQKGDTNDRRVIVDGVVSVPGFRDLVASLAVTPLSSGETNRQVLYLERKEGVQMHRLELSRSSRGDDELFVEARSRRGDFVSTCTFLPFNGGVSVALPLPEGAVSVSLGDWRETVQIEVPEGEETITLHGVTRGADVELNLESETGMCRFFFSRRGGDGQSDKLGNFIFSAEVPLKFRALPIGDYVLKCQASASGETREFRFSVPDAGPMSSPLELVVDPIK